MSDYGKIPPQAIEAEELVLGAILIEGEAMHEAMEIIRNPEVFYVDKHIYIWQAMAQLYNLNTPVDLMTVNDKLKSMGKLEAAGGTFYIAQLTRNVGSSAHISAHAKIIVQQWTKREVISKCTEAIRSAYDDTSDAMDCLESALTGLDAVAQQIHSSGPREWNQIIMDTQIQVKAAAETKSYMTGTSTGWNDFDRVTGGLQDTDLIIAAGRPAMGKTTWALQLLLNIANQNIPVGMFSLEMSAEQLVKKLISSQTEILFDTVKRGGMDREQWKRFDTDCGILAGRQVCMCDEGGLTISQIKSKAKHWKRKYGIKVLIIDYLQLIEPEGKGSGYDTNKDISKISRHLKALAKHLHIPVIALSQLSREVEKRGNKRPMLSDLRDSGAIEQDADMVIFPFRAEYYGIKEYEDGTSTAGMIETIIEKYRNGKTGTVMQRVNLAISKVSDVDRHEYTGPSGAVEPTQQYKKITPRAQDSPPF